jgi:class 3 adenylate cyclase
MIPVTIRRNPSPEVPKVPSRAVKTMIAAIAAAAAGVFLHWALVQPALIAPQEVRVPMFVRLVLGVGAADVMPPAWLTHLNLVLIAAVGLMASGLSLFIVLKSEITPATRRLAAALALAPISAAYFFFLHTHGAYRQALRLDAGPFAQVTASFLAYAAGLASVCLLVQFFLGYPRRPGEGELRAFYRKLYAERLAKVRDGWRRRVYGDGVAKPARSPFLRALGGEGAVEEAMAWKFFASRWPFAVALALALVSAGVDFHAQQQLAAPAAQPDKATRLLQAAMWAVNFMSMLTAMGAAFQGLQYHHREAIADDRARIDWIYGTLLVSSIILIAVGPLWWALLIVLLPWRDASSGPMLLLDPIVISFELFLLAFVASLALSIFYRGAVDPRLAMRRISVLGLMSLVVAVLFVLLERAVAMKIVAWFQLPQETGALIAAAAVAGTLAPVRSTAERSITAFVSRYLPLDSLMEGERRKLAVVISDISGYTALSARDEKQAMLLAALLQRQANKAADTFNGRVVKSMGDAVILAFDSAGSATRAIESLHREFAIAAPVLGLEPLPMHSGAHFGEVTQTHDGDLYGQTINIAARLLSLAAPGQQVVSAEFAAVAQIEMPRLRSLGAKRLKNVPEPVECHELVGA